MTYGSIRPVFCAAHPTPGLGTLSANVVIVQVNGRDRCIDLERLGQGLEAATARSRLASRFQGLTGKT